MIFSTHSIDGIVSGRKTQTRRIVKPSHWLDGDTVRTSTNGKSRVRWEVGRVYSVQPHRNEPGVWWNQHDQDVAFGDEVDDSKWMLANTKYKPLRIRITRIRLEHDVRTISDADVMAEGFSHKAEFLDVWQAMHGQHYQAWALDFEVVT